MNGMTMRGGLTIVTGASRRSFVYTRPTNPLWLAELRQLLAPEEDERAASAPDSTASRSTPAAEATRPRIRRTRPQLRLDPDNA
jgi:hypothetical protein